MTHRIWSGAAIVFWAALSSSALVAQDNPPTRERSPLDQRAPAEKIDPPADRPPRAEAPRPPEGSGLPSGGVIHPPETGDRGVITPPNQDRAPTPELRPPGSPGGNPNVQPR